MNRVVLISLFLVCLTASAKTTLRIPIYGENEMSAGEINGRLRNKGVKLRVPTYLEISTEDQDSGKKYEAVNNRVAQALELLGYMSFGMKSEVYPNADMGGTCYTGRGEKVADLAMKLAGYFYTEQMNLWGYKYKDKTKLTDPNTAEFLNEESNLWRDWRGKGSAVLMAVAIGDGGDDVNATIIPKCE